jgi:multidrug efflux pump subunit AcrB
VLVQTGTYLESAADVRQLVVAVRGEANERKPVFMGDVATVEDGPNQPKAYVWFGSKDGEFPAVTLQISKQPGVNAADVANAAINRINDAQKHRDSGRC